MCRSEVDVENEVFVAVRADEGDSEVADGGGEGVSERLEGAAEGIHYCELRGEVGKRWDELECSSEAASKP